MKRIVYKPGPSLLDLIEQGEALAEAEHDIAWDQREAFQATLLSGAIPMIIHIVRRSQPIGSNPLTMHASNVAYAIVVNGRLQCVIR